MGLLDLFKKKDKKIKVEMYGYENGKRVELNTTNEKFDPQSLEKSISVQLKVKAEIEPIEDRMVGFAVALKQKQKIDNEIMILEALIGSYNAIKQKCYSLGPDYIEYFQNSWGKVRKTHSGKQEYIVPFIERLDFLRENYSELKSKEQIYEKESVNLSSRIISILQANPGILQTEVYKMFDSSVKEDIQSILYFMGKEGRIKRNKSGRTYALYYIK